MHSFDSKRNQMMVQRMKERLLSILTNAYPDCPRLGDSPLDCDHYSNATIVTVLISIVSRQITLPARTLCVLGIMSLKASYIQRGSGKRKALRRSELRSDSCTNLGAYIVSSWNCLSIAWVTPNNLTKYMTMKISVLPHHVPYLRRKSSTSSRLLYTSY